jgi:hypothetical protein
MCSFNVSSAVLAVLMSGSAVVHAGQSSNMAATCSVGDPAIQGNLYTIASGSIRHQPSKSGMITLYCPIASTITIGGGPFGGWAMTFVDPAGSVANHYIRSQIIRCDQSGNVSAVSPVLYGTSATNYVEQALWHTYDFANYYYYVRVDIFRADTTTLPIFYGVMVQSIPYN